MADYYQESFGCIGGKGVAASMAIGLYMCLFASFLFSSYYLCRGPVSLVISFISLRWKPMSLSLFVFVCVCVSFAKKCTALSDQRGYFSGKGTNNNNNSR